jgi:hypothetical protein
VDDLSSVQSVGSQLLESWVSLAGDLQRNLLHATPGEVLRKGSYLEGDLGLADMFIKVSEHTPQDPCPGHKRSQPRFGGFPTVYRWDRLGSRFIGS